MGNIVRVLCEPITRKTKTKPPQPTPAELGILTVLWRLGPDDRSRGP